MAIKDNIKKITEQIENAKTKAGNNNVRLIAISKNHSAQEVQEAYGCGLKIFGENRIQEAVPKIAEAAVDAEWHLVGHLQSNKAAKASAAFTWVDSIDKISTAQKLGNAALALGKTINILIEVNTSGETAKNGIAPDQVAAFAEELAAIQGIQPRGLMTIGPLGGSKLANSKAFSLLRTKLEQLQPTFPDYKELSMGMSGDFEEAIMEGSTMVRIGTAIFGARQY